MQFCFVVAASEVILAHLSAEGLAEDILFLSKNAIQFSLIPLLQLKQLLSQIVDPFVLLRQFLHNLHFFRPSLFGDELKFTPLVAERILEIGHFELADSKSVL